ncbi:MAG: ATP-binding cassette domain-containing protein [Bacteroidales bacterium]|nr:ATP-binding cassette domain-containing protein [Bacteroidales bacterium]
MNRPLFEAISVSKTYSSTRALDQVSMSVPKQSIFGLLGPNGAGKTTLIRIINQITAPDEGEIHLDGKPLRPADISRIGYLPEERGLYKKMKVGEQVLYLARLKGLMKSEALQRLNYWFEKFEIRSWWNKRVEELSKGMQQKVQFIATIIHEPELLIFDEPFSGFDPINVNILKDEILGLREKGATVIFSTHNMASVEELCDRIALIDRSRKILEGSVHQIRLDHRTHLYEVEYENPVSGAASWLPEGFTIVEETGSGQRHTARIRIPDGAGPNDLISSIIPRATIISFRELLPSMNDIFIRTVKEHGAGNINNTGS